MPTKDKNIKSNGSLNPRLALKIAKIEEIVREAFHTAYLYVVGSATYKLNPRDLDMLIVVKRASGSKLARFYRLIETRMEGVKIGATYFSSDRIIGDWNIWIGVLELDRLDVVAPVLRHSWRENYISVIGPPLDAVIPPVKVTLNDVIYGMYGVKYCEDVLANNRAYEAVLIGDSFIRRKVVLSEEQREFFREYCKKWIRRNLKVAETEDARPAVGFH
ncbi:MAG: hypothetical protein ACP5IE_08550 [Infirmifilum sp.]